MFAANDLNVQLSCIGCMILCCLEDLHKTWFYLLTSVKFLSYRDSRKEIVIVRMECAFSESGMSKAVAPDYGAWMIEAKTHNDEDVLMKTTFRNSRRLALLSWRLRAPLDDRSILFHIYGDHFDTRPF